MDGAPVDARLPRRATVAQSIMVTQVKVVGDCYAVYAVNKAGQPVNAYYHPVSLKPVGPFTS